MFDNCLLIHNDNSYLKDEISEKIKFNLENKENSDLDKYITSIILLKIKEKTLKSIIIKERLSPNGLDFYGLILLLHIRLSFELEEKRFLPIIIESSLPLDLISRLSPFAHVLFTENVYFYSSDEIKKKIEEVESKAFRLSNDNFKELFIDKISIKMPRDYLSKHSISNEWSIFKWANILQITDSSIIDIVEDINSILYFKYLKNRFFQNDVSGDSTLSFNIVNSSKILYIDDECKKGWDVIFKKLFIGMNYKCIGDDFKEKDSPTIKDASMAEIKSFNPEIVLLDLRLCDSDFEEKPIEELTGTIILEEIKKYNPGIQCIMFTATSRSVYLDYLNKQGILGYIKKESPEDSLVFTVDNINNLNKLINLGIENKYLIEVYTLTKSMSETLINTFTDCSNNDIHFLKKNVEIIFNILDSNILNKLNYSMLTIFKCLEIIKDMLTEIKKISSVRYVYIKVNKVAKASYSNLNRVGPQSYYLSTGNRLQIILKEKYSFLETSSEYLEITKIVSRRNDYIHPDSSYTDASIVEIVTWTKLLKKIIEKLT